MAHTSSARSAVIGLPLLACAVFFNGFAHAQSDSIRVLAQGTLLVTATVVNSCRVHTSSMAFGAYDPTGANADSPLDGIAAVTVLCGPDQIVEIGLDRGTGAGFGDGTTRAMRSGEGVLGYDLYQDPGRTMVWTDQGNGRVATRPHGLAAPREVTVYGRIPAGQQAAPGQYSDIITVTVMLPG